MDFFVTEQVDEMKVVQGVGFKQVTVKTSRVKIINGIDRFVCSRPLIHINAVGGRRNERQVTGLEKVFTVLPLDHQDFAPVSHLLIRPFEVSRREVVYFRPVAVEK